MKVLPFFVTFLLDTGCTGIVGIPDWLCEKDFLNLSKVKIGELASGVGGLLEVTEAKEPVEFILSSKDKKISVSRWLMVTCSAQFDIPLMCMQGLEHFGINIFKLMKLFILNLW